MVLRKRLTAQQPGELGEQPSSLQSLRTVSVPMSSSQEVILTQSRLSIRFVGVATTITAKRVEMSTIKRMLMVAGNSV